MVKFHRAFDPQTIRLLIFDLDGTLIDSRFDLARSVNATLRHFGRPELPIELIVSYEGDGAAVLVERAFGNPKDDCLLREALGYFMYYYSLHKLNRTTAYDGIKETLTMIGSPRDGTRRTMAVLSNKPAALSREILEGLGLRRFFVSVYGGDSFTTQKPDPFGAREILKQTRSQPDETLIIGDSSNDVLTGRRAGLWTCGVAYGFAPGTLCESAPDVLVDTPGDLTRLLDSGAVSLGTPASPAVFPAQV